ncbi:MAG: hypothetical protein JO269_09700 [Burkholderiaceae bacterium]|nr:hypothetical protein [Burkholderiaceae bacterium]
MGFSAIAAVVEGTATAAEVATAVATVGTITSVVGAVTGNQTMVKVGAVMGLAGGVGSLAESGVNAATDAANTAGDYQDLQNFDNSVNANGGLDQAFNSVAADNAAYGATAANNGFEAANASALTADGVTNPVPTPPAGDVTQLPPANGTGNGLVNSQIAQGANPAATGAITGQTGTVAQTVPSSDAASNIANAGGTQTAASAAAPVPAATAAQTAINPTAANAAANPNLNITTAQGAGDSANLATQTTLPPVQPAGGVTDNLSHMNLPSGLPPANSGSGGFFSGLTNWANNNAGAAHLFGQVGMGALGGLGQAYQASQQKQLGEEQLAQNQQKLNYQNQQVKPAGIINSKRTGT